MEGYKGVSQSSCWCVTTYGVCQLLSLSSLLFPSALLLLFLVSPKVALVWLGFTFSFKQASQWVAGLLSLQYLLQWRRAWKYVIVCCISYWLLCIARRASFGGHLLVATLLFPALDIRLIGLNSSPLPVSAHNFLNHQLPLSQAQF